MDNSERYAVLNKARRALNEIYMEGSATGSPRALAAGAARAAEDATFNVLNLAAHHGGDEKAKAAIDAYYEPPAVDTSQVRLAIVDSDGKVLAAERHEYAVNLQHLYYSGHSIIHELAERAFVEADVNPPTVPHRVRDN